MFRKACDLFVGDIFRLHVYGEVLAVASVAGGKRMKIKIELENQGRRNNSGGVTPNEKRRSKLEFTDTGHVLEFLCPPGRVFRLIEWDDDNDDDEIEAEKGPAPEGVGAA